MYSKQDFNFTLSAEQTKRSIQKIEYLNSFTGHSNDERRFMFNQKQIVIKPIGFVKTENADDGMRDKTRISQIIVNSELTEALEGILGFSHLFILCWLHQISSQQRQTLKVHPRGRKDMPLLGIFATRTKLRPNPIGLTLVELVKVEDNILTVRGLDAFNGTPILDIKPFDSWDATANAIMPQWWYEMEREKAR